MLKAIIPALLMAAIVRADITPKLSWVVDTSRPLSRHLPLIYGETIDVEVCYQSSGRPMDVTGAAVIMHARTNNMDLALSYQTTGSVGRVGKPNDATNGWVYVRVPVAGFLPYGQSEFTYTIDTARDGQRLLRAYGTIGVAASSVAEAVAAQPQSVYADLAASLTNLDAQVADLQTSSATITQLNTTSALDRAYAAALVDAEMIARTNATAGLWAGIAAYSNYVAGLEYIAAPAATQIVSTVVSNYVPLTGGEMSSTGTLSLGGSFISSNAVAAEWFRIGGLGAEWDVFAYNGEVYIRQFNILGSYKLRVPLGLTESYLATENYVSGLGFVTAPDATNIVSSVMATNQIGGWQVWDSGSNRFWTVTATNLRFYVWE